MILGRVSVRCLLSKTRRFFVQRHLYSTKNKSLVPPLPRKFQAQELTRRTRIDEATVTHLERLALVDFGTEQGITIVEDAIRFADQLSVVDTEGVEPLYTVLEKESLSLRVDEVNEGGTRELILANAKLTDEHYFVAPPGNIPIEPKIYDFLDKETNKQS